MHIAGEPIAFRGLEETDVPFIVATWCKSFGNVLRAANKGIAHTCPICPRCKQATTTKVGGPPMLSRDGVEQSAKTTCVLALAYADWVIACAKDIPSTVYGWAAFTPLITNKNVEIKNQNTSPLYAYTVFPLRKNGLYTAIRSEYGRQCEARGDSRSDSNQRRCSQGPDGGEERKAVARHDVGA